MRMNIRIRTDILLIDHLIADVINSTHEHITSALEVGEEAFTRFKAFAVGHTHVLEGGVNSDRFEAFGGDMHHHVLLSRKS